MDTLGILDLLLLTAIFIAGILICLVLIRRVIQFLLKKPAHAVPDTQPAFITDKPGPLLRSRWIFKSLRVELKTSIILAGLALIVFSLSVSTTKTSRAQFNLNPFPLGLGIALIAAVNALPWIIPRVHFPARISLPNKLRAPWESLKTFLLSQSRNIAFLSGVALVAFGQHLRENWFERPPETLIPIGIGLVLLVLGLLRAPGSTLLPSTFERVQKDESGKHPSVIERLFAIPVRFVLAAGGIVLVFLFIPLYEIRDLPFFFIPIPGWTFFCGLGLASLIFSALPDRLFQRAGAVLSKISACSGTSPSQVLFIFYGLVFSCIATYAATFDLKMRAPVLAVFCWIVGIGLCVLGCIQWRPHSVSIPKQALFWSIHLIVAAFILRAAQMDTIPLTLTGDEGNMGLFSIGFLRGDFNNIFTAGWFSFPSLFFYIQSLSIGIFGQDTIALRIVSAGIGSLTIAAVYLVGRIIGGHRLGLLAGLFLMVYHFHIHFSRIGLNNIWDAFFFTVVLGCLWVGWEKHSRTAWIIAGVSLGLSQYFYATSRFLLFLVPFMLVVFTRLKPALIRRILPDAILMGSTALVVFLPLGWFFLNHPGDFMAPMARVAFNQNWLQLNLGPKDQNSIQLFIEQFRLSLQAYTDLPVRGVYQSGTPLLLTIPAILFWIGICSMPVLWRDSRTWLLFSWVFFFAFVGAFSESAPAGHRYIAASPGIALIVAFALETLMVQIQQRWPKISRAAYLIPILGIAIIGFNEAQFYFGTYTADLRNYDDNTLTAQLLANYLKNKPSGTEVIFFGTPNMAYGSIPSLPYLAPHVKGIDCERPWSPSCPSDPNNPQKIFVFLEDPSPDLQEMQRIYPQGRLVIEAGPRKPVLYWLYDITE